MSSTWFSPLRYSTKLETLAVDCFWEHLGSNTHTHIRSAGQKFHFQNLHTNLSKGLPSFYYYVLLQLWIMKNYIKTKRKKHMYVLGIQHDQLHFWLSDHIVINHHLECLNFPHFFFNNLKNDNLHSMSVYMDNKLIT